jgi:hypothetical protein
MLQSSFFIGEPIDTKRHVRFKNGAVRGFDVTALVIQKIVPGTQTTRVRHER